MNHPNARSASARCIVDSLFFQGISRISPPTPFDKAYLWHACQLLPKFSHSLPSQLLIDLSSKILGPLQDELAPMLLRKDGPFD
jgi:hypothetical protein